MPSGRKERDGSVVTCRKWPVAQPHAVNQHKSDEGVASGSPWVPLSSSIPSANLVPDTVGLVAYSSALQCVVIFPFTMRYRAPEPLSLVVGSR